MSISDIWSVLGISPTADTDVIREAYLNALPKYHPEDDPAGFMNLRTAYEAALAEARGYGAPVDDSEPDPGTQGDVPFVSQSDTKGTSPCVPDEPFAEILADFPRRMKEEEWERLFDSYGQDLDTVEWMSEKLLIALMGGQYLPQRIWLLFDKTFSWSSRTKQLKEVFHSGYIEYVLDGMRYERAIRDEFFDFEEAKDEDFDAFVKAYGEVTEAFRSGDLEKTEELIGSFKGSLFSHPDYLILVSRFHRFKEDYKTEQKILDDLNEKWPGDPFIRTAIAETLLNEEPGKALDIYKEILDACPEHYGAIIGAARAKFGLGLFEEAKANSYELLMKDPYDSGAMNVFGAANEALVPVFSERLDKDQGDIEARYKLASCLFNLGKYDEALDLIADTEPDEKHRAKHYELYADVFIIVTKEMGDDDKEILLEYIVAWEEAETDRQRMRFLPEKYHRLGMNDTALEKAEILLIEFPGDPELCRVKAQIYRELGDERSAFAAAGAGLEKNPGHAGLLSMEALLHEEAGNPGAAVDSANHALAVFPFNLEMWELLGRIYERAGRYEDALENVKRAEEFGLGSDALSLTKAIALFETEDPENEALDLFEDQREKDPYNPLILEKLSILYARSGRAEEALSLANLFIEKHGIPFSYLLRGWLFANYPQTSDRFAKARARSDFRKALEMNDRYAPAWYQLGVLAYDEGRMAEAAADFQLTLDIDPDFSDVHYYLALAYAGTGDVLNALRILDEGILFSEEAQDEKAYARLFRKKADILYEYHMYLDLTGLGEKPIDLEEDPQIAFGRRIALADAYFETYEDEKAEEMFRLLLKEYEEMSLQDKAPFTEDLNRCYAMFLRYAKHDIKTALLYYEKSITPNPSMRSVVRLAKAYRAAGEQMEAARLYKKALKYRKKDDDACTDYLNGECYYGLGNIKKAKEYLNRAVNRAGDHSDCPKRCCFEAEFLLSLIALDEGDKEKARKHYETVLTIVQDRDYKDEASRFE